MLKRPENKPFSVTPFDLFTFLEGTTECWGVFEDRKGRVRKRFSIRFEGVRQGNDVRVKEFFRYDDGVSEVRSWTFTAREDGTITGVNADSPSGAVGQINQITFAMDYTFNLAVNGRTFRVKLKDRTHSLTDDLVINRATMSKWGIRLGELVIVMMKTEGNLDIAA